jgi:hypothetical protein
VWSADRVESAQNHRPEGPSAIADCEEFGMKTKEQVQHIMDQIASPSSPVGMDTVFVHAIILEKLESIEKRLQQVESRLSSLDGTSVER